MDCQSELLLTCLTQYSRVTSETIASVHVDTIAARGSVLARIAGTLVDVWKSEYNMEWKKQYVVDKDKQWRWGGLRVTRKMIGYVSKFYELLRCWSAHWTWSRVLLILASLCEPFCWLLYTNIYFGSHTLKLQFLTCLTCRSSESLNAIAREHVDAIRASAKVLARIAGTLVYICS